MQGRAACATPPSATTDAAFTSRTLTPTWSDTAWRDEQPELSATITLATGDEPIEITISGEQAADLLTVLHRQSIPISPFSHLRKGTRTPPIQLTRSA